MFEDDGVVCFRASSTAARDIISHGGHPLNVKVEYRYAPGEQKFEADFHQHCDEFVSKLRHTHDHTHYDELLVEYEHYVQDFIDHHPGCRCSFPQAPVFH